jgi:hypothetical protein
MSNSKQTSTNQDANAAVVAAEKRVILSMGGKGGVGKTSVMAGLAEWFQENEIPVKLLDLDTENKARGSLTHFFGGSVPKVNIHTPAGPLARIVSQRTSFGLKCVSSTGSITSIPTNQFFRWCSGRNGLRAAHCTVPLQDAANDSNWIPPEMEINAECAVPGSGPGSISTVLKSMQAANASRCNCSSTLTTAQAHSTGPCPAVICSHSSR